MLEWPVKMVLSGAKEDTLTAYLALTVRHFCQLCCGSGLSINSYMDPDTAILSVEIFV